MRFRKIYLEISNVCNLSCAFCPGTKRTKHIMAEAEFAALMPKLRPYADYLYFHLMGEPLLHPMLERFLSIAEGYGVPVSITTNGFLLSKQGEVLLHHNKIIKKVKKSPKVTEIFALPGNGGIAADATCVDIGAKDLDNIVAFAKENIKERKSESAFSFELSLMGLGGNKANSYDKNEFSKFANCFDKEIHRLIKEEKINSKLN